MARKRYITTDISLSGKVEELARRCGEYAVLLFTWLVPHADDWGRMEGDADKVFFTVTPRFSFLGRTPNDAAQALEVMDEIELLQWYEVDGNRYIQLNLDTFYELQTYIPREKREQDKSAFPPPTDRERGTATQSSTECYSIAQSGTVSQELAQNTPSPSPSPSGTDDVDNTRARASSGDHEARSISESDVSRVATEYNRTFVRWPTPSIRDQLIDWLGRFSADIVIEAMRRAAMANTKTWAYAQTVLRNWDQANVQTMSDVAAADEAFRSSRRGAGARADPSVVQPDKLPPRLIEIDPAELEAARAKFKQAEQEAMERAAAAAQDSTPTAAVDGA
jgi:DnaD/phage-associated family protein